MQKEKDSLFTKALENVKEHYKLFILAVFALIVFLAGSLRVSAAETDVTVANNAGTYHFFWRQHCEGYKGASNHDAYGSLKACNIDTEFDTDIVIPEDNYFYAIVAASCYVNNWGQGTEGHIFVLYRFNLSTQEVEPYMVNQSYVLYTSTCDNTAHGLVEDAYGSDLPIFDSSASMLSYCTTGDDSGQLNKPVTEDAEGDFALLGFECNNEIVATWTGLNFNVFPEEYENIYVQVKPTYFVKLESGEEYQTFQGVGTLEVPYLDFKFEYAYEDYFIDNPYVGRCELILNFTPIWKPSGSLTWTKGQSVVVNFDENGNITDSILPETALVPQYDDNCKLISPYCNFNKNNTSFYIGWENVSSSRSDNEIISNWLEVEFVDSLWQKAEFSSDYHWGERFFILDYYEDIASTLYSSTENFDAMEIWVTPYYRTANGIYYGHRFIAQLDGFTVTDELESTGDPFGDVSTGESSLQPVSKGDPIFVDGVTPDGGDGWTFDFAAVFNNFVSMVNTFLNSAGQIPALVNKIFGFLPGAYSSMLLGSLALVIVLRVIGR